MTDMLLTFLTGVAIGVMITMAAYMGPDSSKKDACERDLPRSEKCVKIINWVPELKE